MILKFSLAHGKLYFADHEGDFSFADDFAANFALAFGFADFSAEFRHFHFDDQHVPGTDWFAPFYIFSRHEVRDLASLLNSLKV